MMRPARLACLPFLLAVPLSLSAQTVPQESTVSLNGTWSFATDPEGAMTHESAVRSPSPRAIAVPACWEAACPDLINYDGFAWYWRTFHLPARFDGKHIRLTFHAADYRADVWLNGAKLGFHEGGFTPFSFDITGHVKFRRANRLVVRVFDPSSRAHPGMPLSNEIPSGKQNHYCNIGGLWQDVIITARPKVFLDHAFISGDPANGRVRLKVSLNQAVEEDATLTAVIFPESQPDRQDRQAFPIKKNTQTASLAMTVKNPMPWSPETPTLYIAEFTLQSGRAAADLSHVRFGFRTIAWEKGQILLNGRPIYLRFALDQDFYPGTIYRTPSVATARRQFQQARALGLNGNRTHIKIPCPEYLEAADREGFLLWIDFPSWFNLTGRTADEARRQMAEWLRRDCNHPAIIAWSLINEEWGLDMRNPAMRSFLKTWWQEVRLLDPTRLLVDNSPSGGHHVISDLADQHAYFAIPEQRRKAEDWIRTFATDRKARFPWPDSELRGGEPLVWSEMGNWGHPDAEQLLAYYQGRPPYWFRQKNYGGPILAGIARFFDLGLDRVYGGLSSFARAAQAHQEQALRHQITHAMRFPMMAGYVVTQFTDLNSEANGLLTMTRGRKSFFDRTREFMDDVVVIPDIPGYAFFSNAPIPLRVGIANWRGAPINGGAITLSVAGNNRQTVNMAEIPNADVKWCELDPFRIASDKPVYRELVLRFTAKDGKLSAQNRVRIFVAPRLDRFPLTALPGVPDDLSEHCAGTGTVAAASRLDKTTLTALRQGKKVIYFPGSPSDSESRGRHFAWPFNVSTKRPGGSWMQPHTFFKKQGPGALLAGFPDTAHLTLALEKAAPAHFLRGLPDACFRQNVITGCFSGWMKDPAAAMALFRVGKGHLLFYGLDTSHLAHDPAAQWLLHTVIRNFPLLPPVNLGKQLALRKHIVPAGRDGGTIWQYKMQPPDANWMHADFSAKDWQTGNAPFGTQGTPGLVPKTKWRTDRIWLRKTFVLKQKPKAPVLALFHDEDCTVYLNGQLILTRKGAVQDYVTVPLDEKAQALLVPGKCVLAVHCRQTGGGQGVDLGLMGEVEAPERED